MSNLKLWLFLMALILTIGDLVFYFFMGTWYPKWTQYIPGGWLWWWVTGKGKADGNARTDARE